MEHSKIPVTASGEYPAIRVTEPNRRYASLLLQDSASAHGEMTAIYQYLYQHWMLNGADDSLAILLKRIAAVEMHHLDILGKLILLLGGNPICRTNPCNCGSAWNGNMLQYTSGRKQILTLNISLELSAVNDYTAQAEAVKDPLLAAILLRLAEDERVHYNIFRSLLIESA